ncbi:hypothetical protein [Flavobacterium luteum]|uniref:Phage-related membrane protein n=1 Tax=Flavobacterium luteum TaxID=2026654 RepID=A0A7J5AJV6_9FLAO|nr:hypothetical protein [Flavobacterium luteum]KAB1157770.1 hypothetical protein F6464_01415 [Flavobacterium luteum]
MENANSKTVIDNLIKLFSTDIDVNSFGYNGSLLTFICQTNCSSNTVLLKQVFSEVNTLLQNKIEIKLSSCILENTFFYFDIEDYFRKYDDYSTDFKNSNIVILKNNETILFKEKNELFSQPKAALFNFIQFRELINFLISKNEFTPYHNEINKQFVIISKENGAFHIGYSLQDIRLSSIEDLKPLFNELKKGFANKEYIQFFKEVIISGIHQKDIKDRFFEIVKSLKLLLNLTERDYENFVLDFAFDKIKSKFKEERNKYFESLEKNIDIVSKQIVSFPLTFGATAFASYQVKDKPWILGLIVLAYLLYTIIAFKVLSMASYNIQCLRLDVKKEEDEIKASYGKIFEDFKDDFTKIWTKIIKLENLVSTLKCVLAFLLISFTIYSGYQIFNSNSIDSKEKISVETDTINIIIKDKKQTTH